MNTQRLYTFFCFFIIAMLYVNQTKAQANQLRNEIEKIIRFDTEIDFNKTPGFIISVIDNDSVFHFSFGTKVRKTKQAISKDDIFEIGSVSKVFTSTLIGILCDEGLLSMNDKVNNYLPEAYQNPRLENLTIANLVNHQSGLPRRPYFFGKKEKDIRNPYASYTKDDLLKFYRDFIPEQKKFEYSHSNYALLEIIIANITQKSFQDIMVEKIWAPLEMENTFADFAEKKENIIVPGYDRAQKTTTPWSFGSFKGSEGIKTTSEDLVKFLKANMNLSQTGLEPVFAKNFGQTAFKSFNENLSVCMGWHTINMNHFNIITHTGKTTGHNAFVGMVRETKTAVIILANSSVGVEDLALQILRMINYNWKRLNS